jgi:hypothetical protein
MTTKVSHPVKLFVALHDRFGISPADARKMPMRDIDALLTVIQCEQQIAEDESCPKTRP